MNGVIRVQLQQGPDPETYYDSADTSSPADLRFSLHEIIDDHTRFPYTSTATDTWDVLEIADEDQDNANNVIAIYKNASYAKEGGRNSNYNREHAWPLANFSAARWPHSQCAGTEDSGSYPSAVSKGSSCFANGTKCSR
jgi:hypothetical protein